VIDVVCIASWNVDLIVQLDRPPVRGETLMADAFDMLPGGKGSNAAVACARQGARTAVVSRIGLDGFGDMALQLWSQEGIDTTHVVRAAGERSGVAQIWVYADGDNSIAVAPGAGLGLSAAHIEAAREQIANAKVLMASNEVPLEATQAAFAIARQYGVTTLLNPAPAQILPPGLLVLCDILTPNESEARALAGLSPEAPIHEAVVALQQLGAPNIVVTMGKQGCIFYQSKMGDMHIPGWPVDDVLDTVGAGDTFTGVLAAALARGQDIPRALEWANAAAALSVRGRGAIGSMPTLEATRSWLDQNSSAT
jgi:ribokinase